MSTASQQGHRAIVGLLVLLAALPYAGGGFVWDDGPLIADRLALLDGPGIANLWTSPVTGDGPGSSYYRPVSMTILAAVGRLGPIAVHCAAIAVHVLNAILLAAVARRLQWPALAALIYGVHPLLSEALGWASSLPDLLAISAGLGAVLAARRGWFAGAILVVAAGLAKESGLLIPLFLGAAGLAGSRWLRSWAVGCSMVVIARLAAGARHAADWSENVMLAPDALGWSIASLIWPFPLNAVRSLWVTPEWVIPVAGALVCAGLLAARGSREAAGGLGLVLAAPMLALPVMLDGYLVGERYMTTALVGVGVFAAARIAPSRGALAVAVPLAVGSIAVHWDRASDWESDTALFGASVEASPASSYAWHMYGLALAQDGQLRAAANAFGKGLECRNPHPLDRMLRLRALVQAGEPQEALELASRGPKSDLTAEYIAWWARAAVDAGDNEQAVRLMELLVLEQGYDGPAWFAEWAQNTGLSGRQ
ncbi:MAG: hypothetical protein VX944_10490 [Myxococcota bacterium]|nr:hypothetical protein [Myxococcota bacterium]